MHDAKEHGLSLFVQRLATRSILSEEEKASILAWPGKSKDLRARRDFVQIDEEGSSSCLVLTGLVARFGQLRNGDRQTTALHFPGDMADLHSAVRPIGIGGLQTVCDTTILQVPHRAIRECAARYPAVGEALWRDCTLDAAILMQWVVNIGKRDAVTRLAHLFCEVATRSGRPRTANTEFSFPATQEQLGEAAGLTSVHVNRTLRRLREEGLATFRSGVLRIEDWEGLAKLGEFNDSYLMGDTGIDRQKRLLAIEE